MLFAALRFVSDANISDRVYWYLAPFPLAAGESVYAPVGVHNCLQLARVERVLTAEAQNAPYDIAVIKRVEHRAKERVFSIGGVALRDLGGILYDAKHYTHYNRIVFAESGQFNAPYPEDYGRLLNVTARGEVAIEQAINGGEGALLITGSGAREYARKILLAARGREHELQYVKLARLLM